MKRLIFAALAVLSAAAVPALANDKLKVGISGGDSEIIWAAVKDIAQKDVKRPAKLPPIGVQC